MNDEQLIGELRFLGVDKDSHRVVALLPLVQVAWADGTVQKAESDLIQQIASRNGMLHGDGGRILQSWLTHAPTDDYLRRGRRCLVTLASRSDSGLGADFERGMLDDIVGFCERVASAAGGLFGILWSVDARERAAIEEIASALALASDSASGWSELLDDADTVLDDITEDGAADLETVVDE